MKYLITLLMLAITALLPTTAFALDLRSFFPLAVNASNTTLTFSVDSTWHLIEGSGRDISGEILLANHGADGTLELSGVLSFAVEGLDTGNSMRDERMREVLGAETYPKVLFAPSKVVGSCDSTSKNGNTCQLTLHGTLTIKDVTKDVVIPLTLTPLDDGSASVSGELSIRWPEYHVEDPSILIAKLDDTVRIRFTLSVLSK